MVLWFGISSRKGSSGFLRCLASFTQKSTSTWKTKCGGMHQAGVLNPFLVFTMTLSFDHE